MLYKAERAQAQLLEPDPGHTGGGSVMHVIGKISLDLSFILYLIFYLPQLIRNIRYGKVYQLSFYFHALLLIAATADLYYGFGRINQWQYRAVSLVMFACLLFQHCHIARYLNRFSYGKLKFWLLNAIITLMLIGLYFAIHDKVATPNIFIIMGWVERIGYWLYILPQLFKNHRLHSSAAISPIFVGIGIATAICNTISAWVFHWGSPSLYGAPIAIVMHVWLLWQCLNMGSKH